MSKSIFADARRVTETDECLFYHTTDIPGHGTVEGFWDIRGRESEYLGHVDLKGKRVLEIGPGSGFFSFYMERQSAEVVSVEASESYVWEFNWAIDANTDAETKARLESHRRMMERQRNSYWFCHCAFESQNKIYYGSAYNLPPELGEFDVSVLGCILLHNKNPLVILENCARLTRETIVVVEPHREELLAQTATEFLPAVGANLWHEWWGFSPKYFAEILSSMGFTRQRVNFHTQKCFGEPAPLFTFVARHENAKTNEDSRAEDDENKRVGIKITTPVESLRLKTNERVLLHLNVRNTGDAALTSAHEKPFLLSYHWRAASGEMVVWDGVRTKLPRPLHAGDEEKILLNVKAPTEAGVYRLEATLVREGVAWYDEEIDGLPFVVPATIFD